VLLRYLRAQPGTGGRGGAAARQVERPRRLGRGEAAAASPLPCRTGQAGEIDARQRDGGRGWIDCTAWPVSSLLSGKTGAQGLVAAHHLGQARRERRGVEPADQADGRAGCRRCPTARGGEEPEPLLGKGERRGGELSRRDRTTNDRHDRREGSRRRPERPSLASSSSTAAARPATVGRSKRVRQRSSTRKTRRSRESSWVAKERMPAEGEESRRTRRPPPPLPPAAPPPTAGRPPPRPDRAARRSSRRSSAPFRGGQGGASTLPLALTAGRRGRRKRRGSSASGRSGFRKVRRPVQSAPSTSGRRATT